MSTCFAEMLEFLQSYPNGITAKDLSYIMSIGRQTASNRLSRMTAYGHTERVPVLSGRPKYRVKINGGANV